MTLDEMNKLREAAQAVVDRWYTPKWNWTHDAIGELIAAVRDALAEDRLDEMQALTEGEYSAQLKNSKSLWRA